jgi:ribosome-associated toxin RatA of RatAB toxin-antitoxin module
MKHVQKSVLLWYSPHEMYSLVTAVEDYPKFLPWCDRAEVVARDSEGLTARLGLAYMGVHHSFTTRNVQVPDQSVNMELVDGPFSQLDGTWRFLPIGTTAQACKVEFDLRYAFARGALEGLISPVFDRIANTFVDAFVRRAEQVHGAR